MVLSLDTRHTGFFLYSPNCFCIDFDETFSPIVKLATICIVLSLTLSRSRSIHQIDVKNVFLHNTLDQVVYSQQLVGFVGPSHPHRVCRLNKPLYGLKYDP